MVFAELYLISNVPSNYDLVCESRYGFSRIKNSSGHICWPIRMGVLQKPPWRNLWGSIIVSNCYKKSCKLKIGLLISFFPSFFKVTANKIKISFNQYDWPRNFPNLQFLLKLSPKIDEHPHVIPHSHNYTFTPLIHTKIYTLTLTYTRRSTSLSFDKAQNLGLYHQFEELIQFVATLIDHK